MSQPDPPDDELDKGVDDFTVDELIEIGGLSDEEFERRFGPEPTPDPPPRQLPPDLGQLYEQVSDVAINRRVLALEGFDPKEIPGHPFEGFEAVAAKIGGMGLVLEARDPELERKVAIKLWKQSGPKAQQALLDEAKMLAKLSDHNNVVTVYGTGRWGERVFFVMEWIDGVDGHEWLKTPRSWREARDVFVDAGKGLAAAHEAGIQHRDFKPDNMLVGKGRTVVADFGIADSLRNTENTDPRWGTPAGTPAYMAPERLRGEPGDARSDQFSFCVALWRALYRLRPFAGEEPEELLEAIELGEIRTVPGVEVPRWLIEVVRKGLAHDPDERYGSMHEIIAALLAEPPDEPAIDDGAVDEVEVEVVAEVEVEVVAEEVVEAVVEDVVEAVDEEMVEAVDEDVVEVGERVLHESGVGATAQATRRSPYFAVAVIAALVAVIGFSTSLWWRPTPAPQAVGVTIDQVILELVAEDQFAAARQLWRDHKSELTDGQLLEIAKACLARAKQLGEVDRGKAEEAAMVAWYVASDVRDVTRYPAIRKTGGQLASDAWALVTEVDHPSRAD